MHRAWLPVLSLAVASGLVLGAGLTPAPATAAPVIYNFTGYIFTSETPLTTIIFTSDTVKGSFTFESTTPASPAATPQLGNYPGAVTAFSMDVLGPGNVVHYHTQWTAGANAVTIINNDTLPGGLGP